MRIHLHALCWNDLPMLEFFFRHYDWVDRFFISDDGSTDGSRECLSSRHDVILRDFKRRAEGSFVRSAQRFYNTCWRKSVGKADWVVITNLDEHLYHREMRNYLADLLREGCTAAPSLGYQMIAESYPAPGSVLWRDCRQGAPWSMMSKLTIFRPDRIRETNYAPGRHTARFEGEVVLPSRDEVLNLHYKYLGVAETQARHEAQRERLGPVDVARGWGHRYSFAEAELRDDFERFRSQAVDVHEASPDAHPETRWWRETGSGERRL